MEMEKKKKKKWDQLAQSTTRAYVWPVRGLQVAWWGCADTQPVLLPSMPAFIRRAHASASLTHRHTHTCVYKRAENFCSSVMPRRRQRKCGRERSAGLGYGIFAHPWAEVGGPAAGTGWV